MTDPYGRRRLYSWTIGQRSRTCPGGAGLFVFQEHPPHLAGQGAGAEIDVTRDRADQPAYPETGRKGGGAGSG